MNEPITLCRYDEQDEIEKGIKWLGEHINETVLENENIMKHNGERELFYTVLKGMYTILCHRNGLFNKLEG